MENAYFELYWNDFHERESKHYDVALRKYKKKGYLHFDQRIWYPDSVPEIQKFVRQPANVAAMRFRPFLQVVVKTPRIRFDETHGVRKLQYKPRPIAYASHFDALVYSFYASILSIWYQSYVIDHGLNQCVLAYRKLGYNNIHFAKRAFDHIKSRGKCVAIALDITGFFDSLDHQILKDSWLEVLHQQHGFSAEQLPPDHFNLFRSLTRYSFVCKQDAEYLLDVNPEQSGLLKRLCDDQEFDLLIRCIVQVNKEKGIPQGTPISAVLSNIYMIGFDRIMCKMASRMGAYYCRYCDDILLVCDEEQVDTVQREVVAQLNEMKLEVNSSKTDVVTFRNDEANRFRGFSYTSPATYKNLQYLGFEFSGAKVTIRSASMSRYYRRMKSLITETTKRAYGRKSQGTRVGRATLYKKQINDWECNFPGYAKRANQIFTDNDDAIRHQMRNRQRILKAAISKNAEKRKARVDGRQVKKTN